MSLKLIAGPAREPIHLTEAKLHLKVEYIEDDSLILASITAARQYAEDFTSRQLVTATYELQLDCFPWNSEWKSYWSTIEIPRAPLQSIVSITYVDMEGVTQIFPANKYIVDTNSEPGRIALAPGESWMSTRTGINAVQIRFIAGHSTPFLADETANTFMALGRLVVNNELVRLWNSGGTLPLGLSRDIDYYVVSASGSTFQLSLTEGGAPVDITNPGKGTHFTGNIPREILQGILVDLTDLYENRESVVVGTTRNTIPTLERLYWTRRVVTF